VRAALQGKWVLISLNMNAEDGRNAPVDATGILTSDQFGGLNVEYRLSDQGRQTLAKLGHTIPNPVISTSGSVVIDPVKKSIVYVGDDFGEKAFDADLAARRANPFALERTRYYTLGADGILTLQTRYDSGKPAAVSRWKKQ
jgi:hypothetical protein